MTPRPSLLRLALLLLTLSVGVAGCSESTTTSPLPEVTVTAATLPTGIVGTPYTFSLEAAGGGGRFRWSLASGTLPTGLSLSEAGVLSGTPSAAGTFDAVVRVVSGDRSATAAVQITVVQPAAITTDALPDGVVGTTYSATLTATGGTGSYAWALASGVLPDGIALSSGGVLSGTPAAAGDFDFTVRVTTGAQSTTRTLRISVSEVLEVTASPTAPGGFTGSAYAWTIGVTGGTGTYAFEVVDGALPPGLAMAPASGRIAGTPTTPGDYAFTVAVTSGIQSRTASFSLTVVDPLVIGTGSLAGGIVGVAYSATVVVSGGTGVYDISVSSGALPAGLALDATGTISGTPTAPGSSAFTVQVVSGDQTRTVDLSIAILPAVSITTTSLPNGQTGVPYTQALVAAGATGVYTWSVSEGALPAGLSLGADGAITGTPTGPETAAFTVRVESGGSVATQALQITVVDAVAVTTTTLPQGLTGTAYAQTLAAVGGDGSFTWALTAGALPAGLTLATDGTLAGTPTESGTFVFTAEASSAGVSASRELTLVVLAPVAITTTTLPPGVVGEAYDQTLVATGGDGSYSWALTAGALPTGLSLDAATGRISGTAFLAMTFNFTIEATSGALSASRDFTVTVTATGCTLASTPDSDGDRLPDCVETNTNTYVSTTDTGTDPNDADSDDDGIPDGDEVLGTVAGLDLPAMGTNPLKKNILIEYDWFGDSEGGTAHDHRPSASTISKVAAVFAAAPVSNPDGSTGIVVIQDYGQGGAFTGGTVVADVDGCIVGGVGGTDYANAIAANFDANRVGYFHYSLMIHQYDATGAGSCAGASGSSGQAFYDDHRLLVSSNWWHNDATSGDQWVANTIVHELGHNLNLSHGGSRAAPQEGYNYKPNYPSVMNYRYQFSGVDSDCDVIADNVLDYSRGTRISLNEASLSEAAGVCGSTPVDWNTDGDSADAGIAVDVQGWDQGAGSAEANGSAADVLEDFDDWANLTLVSSLAGARSPLRGFDLDRIPESCAPAPEPAGGRR